LHSAKVLRIIKDTWEKRSGDHVPTTRNPYYFVNSEELKAEAIKRLSYLAKTRGKGHRDFQVKDYGASRLTAIKDCKLAGLTPAASETEVAVEDFHTAV